MVSKKPFNVRNVTDTRATGVLTAMDMQIDAGTLARHQSVGTALRVLEASIQEVLGFHVQVMSLNLWASPTLFESNRVPERYVRLPVNPEQLEAGPAVPVEWLLQAENARQAALPPAPRAKRYMGGQGRAAKYE